MRKIVDFTDDNWKKLEESKDYHEVVNAALLLYYAAPKTSEPVTAITSDQPYKTCKKGHPYRGAKCNQKSCM